MIFILVRALTYASIFVALVFIFLPARLLGRAGVAPRSGIGALQIAGMCVAGAGTALALWSVLAFAIVGRGTPAPFDPPRRLVVRGPYRFVRNPMYIGAGLALIGAAMFYRAVELLVYVAALWAITHVFILSYEEPSLGRLFGTDYDQYRLRVRRWLPRL